MALGFIGRISRAIRNIVAPSPRAPEPPPEPPREPPQRAEREYREIWDEQQVRRGKGNFQKNLKVFHSVIDRIEQDPDERLELWESYVQNMVKPGRTKRQDPNNPFWRESGIDPSNFKWQQWREAMGYTGKRRSRTP